MRLEMHHVSSVEFFFFACGQISPSGVVLFLRSKLHTRPLVLTKVVTDPFTAGASCRYHLSMYVCIRGKAPRARPLISACFLNNFVARSAMVYALGGTSQTRLSLLGSLLRGELTGYLLKAALLLMTSGLFRR